MRIGSLFSGIGGFELGLERAGLGEVVYQVEADPFCRRILAQHWPDVPRFEDVRAVGLHNLPAAEILAGGFPCQDVSMAGRREGLDGERSGLWWEFHRVIDETSPNHVVVENVHAGSSGWLPSVRESLWRIGYASVPIRVQAADVGARHYRARAFVLATRGDRFTRFGPEYYQRLGHWAVQKASNDHRARLHRSADKAVPRAADVCDADGERLEGLAGAGSRTGARGAAPPGATGGLAPWPGARRSMPLLVRSVHGISGGLDGRERGRRIKALGNSVVPIVAEAVGLMLGELIR